MDIGEMKQRIEFMVEENVSDGQGGYDTTLVSKGSTWAKVTNIHGGEYFFCRSRPSGKGCVICYPIPLGYLGKMEH
nr:MAG TPA: head-tail adaptor [Caudoviricetes sp.]